MKQILIRVVIILLLFALGVAIVRLGFPSRVVVTWETASEVDTAGFLLYRSDSPASPFSLLTETPVPAQGDPLVGDSYRYVDRDVTWGQRYFYQLEEVERNGARHRFPNVVEGRAGVGWPWALAAGAVLAILGGVGIWPIPKRDGPQPKVATDDDDDA
jgi:hypothetical protein